MVVELETCTSPEVKLMSEMERALLGKDFDFILQRIHKDFRYIYHPRSLGRPPMAKDEWLATMAGVFRTPIQFDKPIYHSVTEAPGKVIFHVSLGLKGLSGPVQDGTDESIWITSFAPGEDGSLTLREVEQFTSKDFVDIWQFGRP